MAITPLKCMRKPLFVEAVEVTHENLAEVSAWCRGHVKTLKEDGINKIYIKVNVRNAKDPRQTMAFAGDWVLLSPTGYKVYNDKAFKRDFEMVPTREKESNSKKVVVNVSPAKPGEEMHARNFPVPAVQVSDQ